MNFKKIPLRKVNTNTISNGISKFFKTTVFNSTRIQVLVYLSFYNTLDNKQYFLFLAKSDLLNLNNKQDKLIFRLDVSHTYLIQKVFDDRLNLTKTNSTDKSLYVYYNCKGGDSALYNKKNIFNPLNNYNLLFLQKIVSYKLI